MRRATPSSSPFGNRDRDERHLARVIDLRHAGEEPVRQVGPRREEAHAHVLRRRAFEEARVERLVLGADRAQQHAAEVPDRVLRLPFHRIGTDRHRMARLGRGVGDAHARIERDAPVLVRQQRIDVELADLGMVASRDSSRARAPARWHRCRRAAGRDSPPADGLMRVSPMSWPASFRSSGGSACAVSAITSTAVPPAPNIISGPTVGVVAHADDQLVRVRAHRSSAGR